MQFSIDASLSVYFDYIAVAWVRVRLAPSARANTKLLDSRKQAALEALLQRFPDETAKPVDWKAIPSAEQWLDAYKTMGLKVKKTKPTHVALATRLIKQRAWPRSIGPLVDTYLVNQIDHIMPHGGFDVKSLPSDVTIELLRTGTSLPFQPMGVQADDIEHFEHTDVGEVVYQSRTNAGVDSDATTLTRYLNYRDGEPTKIIDDNDDESKSTKDFVLIIESVEVSDEGRKKLWQTACDLEALYKDVYGDGVQQSYVRVLEAQLKGDTQSKTMSLDW